MFKKVSRKISALLLFSLFSLSALSGCVPHTELNEKAIILAIGVDYEDEKYKVMFQYYNPTGIGGRTLVDNSQPNVLTSKGEGDNVYAALEDATFRCGREMMLGVTQFIVIGKKAAENSVEKVMDFTKSFFQSHPDMLVTVAEEEAEKVLEVKFSEGIVSTQKLKFLLTNAEKSGIVALPNALELFTALQTVRQSSALPRLRLLDSGQSDASEDGKTLEISGGVLINEGKAVDEVDIEVMSGLQILCCKTETGTVTVDYKDEKISVGLVNIKTKIKPSFENDQLVLTVDLRSGGRFLATPKGRYEDENDELEKLCGDAVIKRMESAVKQTVFKYGADPFLLEKTIRHYDYGLWKKVEENFGEYLKNAKFKFSSHIEIDKMTLSE